jgi:predicted dehydrogenase
MSGKAARPTVVVAGTGFGLHVHVPALRAAGFEVVGLVGSDPKRTAERAAGCGVAGAFTDLDEAIARTGATAATVATPPHTHAPLVLQAVGRGCHVLCEKPFAANAAEARAMLAGAQKAGVTHVIGNEFRWLPDRAVAAQAIADGLIGDLKVLTFAQYHHFVGNPAITVPEWWLDPQAGGGWLGTWGSHVVDWVRSWAGEFASLSAALPSVAAPPGGVEDSYLVRFRLASGAQGVFSQTSGSWGPLTAMVRVAGTKGTIWLDGGDAWIADAQGDRKLPVPDHLQLPAPPVSEGDGYRQSGYEIPPFTRLCETWLAMIEGRKPASQVAPASFADGVAAMEVLDAIRASAAADGAVVRIDG